MWYSSPAFIAVLVAAGILGIITAIYFMMRKKYDVHEPKITYQLKTLKRNTVEFGVAYENLEFGRLLGKGSQGEVFFAKLKGLDVAVKKIDTRKVSSDIIEEFCSEAEIMRQLRHPCLCLFMGVSLEHPHLCIVTELAHRGSLFDIMHDEVAGEMMTWKKCIIIAKDIAQGMAYLHAHQPPILHRDLKSLNILVDSNWRAKVADFGMTTFKQDEGTMTQCGSPLWMAPEMIQHDAYDEKADVYSFAVVLWELYARKIPYRDLEISPSELVVKVVKEQLRPPVPPTMPDHYSVLIRACWHPDPHKRPKFSKILKVLEGFSTSSIIMNHVPMTNKRVIVQNDDKKTEEEKGANSIADQNAWKIPDKSLVELGGQIDSSYHVLSVSGTKGPLRSMSIKNEKHVSMDPAFKLLQPDIAVFQGKYRGKSVAVSLHASGEGVEKRSDEDVWKTIKATCDVRHPNLVLFMGAYLDGHKVGVVNEFMSHGSLPAILSNPNYVIDWNTTLNFLVDAASGLLALHALRPPIIHQDLRTTRMLVDANWRVKVSEYGFVDLASRLHQRALSPSLYSAPEVLRDPRDVSCASNVYSFALIMVEIYTRSAAWAGVSEPKTVAQDIVNGSKRPELPASLPPRFVQLVNACWDPEPSKRPTFAIVLDTLKEIQAAGPTKLLLKSGSNASVYRKSSTVKAYVSKDPVTILKDWGVNKGKKNWFVICGGDDDVYVVDPETMNATYEVVGDPLDCIYRKTGTVLGRRMNAPFAIRTASGTEQGMAGDFLVQNEKGDQWSVPGATFESVYEVCPAFHVEQALCVDEEQKALLAPSVTSSSSSSAS